MHKYTVAPLVRIFSGTGRDYVTRKELFVTQASWPKTPTGNRRADAVYRNYHAVFEFLTSKFHDRTKISQEEIIDAGNTFLRSSGYGFGRALCKPASTRRIYQTLGQVPCYDWAYFPPAGTDPFIPQKPGHSHHRALFYHREEILNDITILGNLQIDNIRAGAWKDPTLENTLLWRKNLYRMMVQEAIKQALESGTRRIIFQAGGGAAWAQWNSEFIDKTTRVTPENFSEFEQQYHRRCHIFDQLRLGPNYLPSVTPDGELPYSEMTGPYDSDFVNRRFLVYDKTPEFCTGYLLFGPIQRVCFFEQLLHYLWNLPAAARKKHPYMDFYDARRGLNQFWAGFTYHEPAWLLPALTTIFQTLDPEFVPKAPATQERILAMLRPPQKEVFSCVGREWKIKTPWLDEFLFSFDYHKVFLRACPEIRLIPLPDGYGPFKYLFIDQTNHYNVTVRRENIRPPKIGDHYSVHGYKNQAGWLCAPPRRKAQVYAWYERTLPKILTRLQLGVEKIVLPGVQQANITGWEITSGLNEFAQRPLILF